MRSCDENLLRGSAAPSLGRRRHEREEVLEKKELESSGTQEREATATPYHSIDQPMNYLQNRNWARLRAKPTNASELELVFPCIANCRLLRHDSMVIEAP